MAVKKKETKVNTAPVEVRVKEVDEKVALALKALDDYATFDQEKIDYIVAKCTVQEGVEKFAKAVHDLGVEVGMAMNFKSQNVDKKEWEENLEKLAYLSYEDQCSPANPRVPMIKDMIELMRAAYEGTEIHYEQH